MDRPSLEEARRIAEELLTERFRQQISGYTPEHDDTHTQGEIAAAAAAYATGITSLWPWLRAASGVTGEYRNRLVKAGAMILAELERYDRAEEKAKAQEPHQGVVYSSVQDAVRSAQEGEGESVPEADKMREDTVGDLKMEVFYLPASHNYRVTVTSLTSGVSLSGYHRAIWEPRFGIDVADDAAVSELAETLAIAIERGQRPAESVLAPEG